MQQYNWYALTLRYKFNGKKEKSNKKKYIHEEEKIHTDVSALDITCHNISNYVGASQYGKFMKIAADIPSVWHSQKFRRILLTARTAYFIREIILPAAYERFQLN